MSDSLEPQWELLPGDPEGFFGVSGNYELRDLKRSYNQLIRRYKPERSPDEFQQIRAAFELLSDALRFHVPKASPPRPPGQTPGSSAEPAASNQSRPEERDASVQPAVDVSSKSAQADPEPFMATLARKAPAELFAELQSKSNRRSEDYVTLALLADLLRVGTSPSFYDWLLEGLADRPRDWGLTQLLRYYLSESHPVTDLPGMLTRAISVLPPDRFQYATERAWDRLLREGTFEQYRDCLDTCGQHLGQALGSAQPMFYVHALRMVLWTANDEFVRKLQEVVEDSFEHLDTWAQEEYELTSQLVDYLRQREAFIARGPACERIDRTMRDWCLLREEEGDLSVLDCLYFLSQQGQRLLSEFSDFERTLTVVLLPWECIVADVVERQGEPEEMDDQALAQHARNFMIRVIRRHKRTGRHYQGLWLIVLTLAVLFLSLVLSGALLVRMVWKWFTAGNILGGVLDGFLSLSILVSGFALAVIAIYIGRKIWSLRYDHVRGELIKLLRVTPVPVNRLAQIILQRENEHFGAENDQRIDDTRFIARGMLHDSAIALFALAQQALHVAAPDPVVEAAIVASAQEPMPAPTRPLGQRLG